MCFPNQGPPFCVRLRTVGFLLARKGAYIFKGVSVITGAGDRKGLAEGMHWRLMQAAVLCAAGDFQMSGGWAAVHRKGENL